MFPKRIGQIAVYALLGAAAIWYADTNLLLVAPALGLPSDFSHYYEAGGRILHRTSPYYDSFFLYPAIVAIAAAPLALTTYLKARWIWFLLSHAMLLCAAILIWRRFGRGLGAACCVALVWACGGAARESLALGQIGPLLVLLLAWAYTSPGAGRGFAGGIAAALKIVPGVMLLPLACFKQWREVFSIAAIAVTLTAGPALAIRGFDGPRFPGGRAFVFGTPAILSWSVPSTVLRAMDPPVKAEALPHNWEFGHRAPDLQLPIGQIVASIVSSLLILAVGTSVLAWRARTVIAAKELPVLMAGSISLALAAAPVCWTHYQILQYPGVALMLGVAVMNRQLKLSAAIILCSAFLYPIPVAVLTHYYHRYGWTAASPWQLYLWTSVTPLAALAIFGLSLKLAEAAAQHRGSESATEPVRLARIS